MTARRSRIVSVFGLPISNVGMRQTLHSIESRIATRRPYQIATANLDFVRHTRRDPELHRLICDCAMVLPDGFPLLWASRLLGHPLMERVAGSDLTVELARLSAKKGYRIFLLGSSDENAQAAMRTLEEKYPGVQFAGQYAPANIDPDNDRELCERICAANADILLVAFGNPKQEFWIRRNLHRLNVPVSIGIGGTLDMIAGARRRAPGWVQKLNLEWAYRMLQEPTRLAPRYAADVVALLRYLPLEILAHHLQEEVAHQSFLYTERGPNTIVLRMTGHLTGSLCGNIRDAATECANTGSDLVIDCTRVDRMDADGLGCMIDARRTLESHGLSMKIENAHGSVLRLFQASSLRSLEGRQAKRADMPRQPLLAEMKRDVRPQAFSA